MHPPTPGWLARPGLAAPAGDSVCSPREPRGPIARTWAAILGSRCMREIGLVTAPAGPHVRQLIARALGTVYDRAMGSSCTGARVSRRGILRALGSTAAIAASMSMMRGNQAWANAPKVGEITRDKLGTTIVLHLKNAPFPFGGAGYDDDSVYVYVPHHFRVPEDKKVDAVLHFHGHGTTALAELKKHRLREQFSESLQNAILIVPQGPVNAKDSSGGKLEQPRGLLELLTELRSTMQLPEVSKALGEAKIVDGARIGALCISAHSGGYRVTARCLEHGGFDVNEVWLFDALYGEVSAFEKWLLARRDTSVPRERHKLVSYYGKGRTATQNQELMERLSKANLSYLHEENEGELTRAQITKGRAVFIKTHVDHTRLTYKYNTLRDCLYASSLKRRLKSNWFADKNAERKLEERD